MPSLIYFDRLKLRELRVKAGLTQVQLAEEIGTSQSHIHKLESGAYLCPYFDQLYLLSVVLGVEMIEFVKEDARIKIKPMRFIDRN